LSNMKRRLTFYYIIAGIFTFSNVWSEDTRSDIRIMFYNTENTFDTYNDSLKNDEEFLPTSERRWTTTRYYDKLNSLFKTIAAVGEISPPDIICLAEIENKRVLRDLLGKTPLEKYPFQIVHFDSPDQRGIDVAILFRSDKFNILSSKYIRIKFAQSNSTGTRDILYAKLNTLKGESFHIFVNHWPSRRGGKSQSEGKRIFVASQLKKQVDSIFIADPHSKIIITGDFNDEPTDKSLSQTLKALVPLKEFQDNALYNLSGLKLAECKCGTYRYKTDWNMLDQFIVSGSLLNSKSGLNTCTGCIEIADFEFLLKEEKKYGGKKPFPTYRGPQYQGGYSDHLPIFLDLYYH
jgi:endonuclease/exonuclease/phosphatase family metal-dependent hydrolase